MDVRVCIYFGAKIYTYTHINTYTYTYTYTYMCVYIYVHIFVVRMWLSSVIETQSSFDVEMRLWLITTFWNATVAFEASGHGCYLRRDLRRVSHPDRLEICVANLDR